MSGQELPPQRDIRRATFRILDRSPGHTRYGVWVNGGKCGDLTVGNDECVAFEQLLRRGGFEQTELEAPDYLGCPDFPGACECKGQIHRRHRT